MPVIGIDLGTTNSLIAYWTEEGPHIIPNVLGEPLTPSVVSVGENGEIFVGEIAKERLLTHPLMTASEFKRFMGTEKKYHLGKHVFRPEELSALVLKSLKADAEAFFKEPITSSVISVPAYFNDLQRNATKTAAELAGLRVERLISEPTAAAIAYGVEKQEANTQLLVLDLGGGTFDVSVLEMFEGVMEVKSVAGDNFLGGEDFTTELCEHICKIIGSKWDELPLKSRAMIRSTAEKCKVILSFSEMFSEELVLSGVSYTINISRTEFENLCENLILRIRKPVEKALIDAKISPKELEMVILIGGATRMPVIRNLVTRMFNRFPMLELNPDETVALGAAVQAALVQRHEALSEVIMTDVCPFTLGVDCWVETGNDKFEEGIFAPVIERNTTIPVSREMSFGTLADNQSMISFGIYQGESRKIKNNLKLGEVVLRSKFQKKGHEIIVRFTYDVNGILSVDVHDPTSNVKTSVVIEKSPGALSKEQIAQILLNMEKLKIHPRDKIVNRLLIQKGERLYEENTGQLRDEIGMYVTNFEGILATQDEKLIRKEADNLRGILKQYERNELLD